MSFTLEAFYDLLSLLSHQASHRFGYYITVNTARHFIIAEYILWIIV